MRQSPLSIENQDSTHNSAAYGSPQTISPEMILHIAKDRNISRNFPQVLAGALFIYRNYLG
jgi:hypothetical protein